MVTMPIENIEVDFSEYVKKFRIPKEEESVKPAKPAT